MLIESRQELEVAGPHICMILQDKLPEPKEFSCWNTVCTGGSTTSVRTQSISVASTLQNNFENSFLLSIILVGEKRIQTLPVHCSNHSSKCEWLGTVGSLGDHLAACQYALLLCPKQCKDSGGAINQFMRKDLTNHLKVCPNRDFECRNTTMCVSGSYFLAPTLTVARTCNAEISRSTLRAAGLLCCPASIGGWVVVWQGRGRQWRRMKMAMMGSISKWQWTG